MAVSHDDLLAFSARYVESHDEVERRAAASRGYYSIYHYLQTFSFFPKAVLDEKTGIHSRLIKALTQSPDMQTKAAGYVLQQAHSIRLLADYELESAFREEEAKQVMDCAKRIKARLEPQEETGS